jgi:cytoskeletal protein RodZ
VRLRPPSASRTGEELRNARIRCGYDVVSVARELGVPPGDLRALEWDRADLLGDRYAAKLLRTYVEWLEPEGVPRPIKAGFDE